MKNRYTMRTIENIKKLHWSKIQVKKTKYGKIIYSVRRRYENIQRSDGRTNKEGKIISRLIRYRGYDEIKLRSQLTNMI